jgi:hypothetical protein
MILALAKHLPHMNQASRNGNWDDRNWVESPEIDQDMVAESSGGSVSIYEEITAEQAAEMIHQVPKRDGRIQKALLKQLAKRNRLSNDEIGLPVRLTQPRISSDAQFIGLVKKSTPGTPVNVPKNTRTAARKYVSEIRGNRIKKYRDLNLDADWTAEPDGTYSVQVWQKDSQDDAHKYIALANSLTEQAEEVAQFVGTHELGNLDQEATESIINSYNDVLRALLHSPRSRRAHSKV